MLSGKKPKTKGSLHDGMSTHHPSRESIFYFLRKGNLPNVRLVDGSFCAYDTLWCGCPRKSGTAQYLYHFLLAYGVEKLDRGAGKPEITKGRLKRVMVPLPGADLLAKFEKAAAECYQLIASLETGNRVLEHERDALIETQLGRYSSASF